MGENGKTHLSKKGTQVVCPEKRVTSVGDQERKIGETGVTKENQTGQKWETGRKETFYFWALGKKTKTTKSGMGG